MKPLPPLFTSRRGIALALIPPVVLIALLAAVAALRSPVGSGKNETLLTLQPGMTLKSVAHALAEKRVVSRPSLLVLYGRLRGDAARIQAGTYRFTDAMPATEILRMMVAGEVFLRPFVLPRGYSLYQAAELLEQQGLLSAEKFQRQCFNRKLLAGLGIDGASAEGYLCPSTYNVLPGMDEAQLITEMIRRFDSSLRAPLEERVRNAGMSWREVLILASMIEKEAVVPRERELIASVFRNRLRKGMRLQSDPTAVYGVRSFAGRVTKADILRPSPYNTYSVKGLPAGPIGNPGREAIEAVLSPAATPYLYFVAKRDGTHHFSSSLDEHNDAVRRYLRES